MPNASRSTRRCSECGELVEGRAMTCGATCRSRRSRRLKRGSAHSNGGRAGGNRLEDEVYDAEQHEIMVAVTQKVLEPYARDQLSEDVIDAIGGIMALAPAALVVLEKDLTHNDPQIRHKAAALIMRYSMPEKFLPANVGGDNTLKIDLGSVPTPSYETPQPQPVSEVRTDLRECDTCTVAKPETDFDAGAPRCNECQDALRERLLPSGD